MSSTFNPAAGNPATAAASLASVAARRRSLFWRLHFWAALIATPFTLVATLTGILYIFTPQIETALYDRLDHVAPAGQMRPLDELVAAAQTAAPAGMQLQSVLPPFGPRDTLKASFAPAAAADPHAGHRAAASAATASTAAPAAATPAMAEMPDMPGMAMPSAPPAATQAPAAIPATGAPDRPPLTVYIDPYSGKPLGSLANADRFGQWAKKLHSRLLQGEGWRWMIELAASWMMVLLLSGVYLWWPRGGQSGLPRRGAGGRQFWRQWHAFLGVALGTISLVILLTGLTWSKYAGDQVRVLRDAAGQASPQVPATLASAPPPGAEPGAAAMLGWQAAWQFAKPQSPPVPLMLTAPRGPLGVWRAGAAGREHPTSNFDLLLDAYSGQRLYYSGWAQQTAFGKATAVGIPFHRGEYGWWNQALLLVFGISVLFCLLSGWLMFWRRRRPGTLGLPRLLPGAWRAAPPAAWGMALLLGLAMPLFALSGAALLLLELLLRRPWTLHKGEWTGV